MSVVPVTNPVTTPEAGSTVAIAGLLLDQVPPGVAFASVVAAPSHTFSVPVIGVGAGSTVTTCVATAVPQALVTLYDISTVPKAIPFTIPVGYTIALLLPAIQVPPVPVAVSGIVNPLTTDVGPLIVPATGGVPIIVIRTLGVDWSYAVLVVRIRQR